MDHGTDDPRTDPVVCGERRDVGDHSVGVHVGAGRRGGLIMRTRTSLLRGPRTTRRGNVRRDIRSLRSPVWQAALLLGAVMLAITGCSSDQWATGSKSTAGSGHTDANGNCSLLVSDFNPTPTASGYKVSAWVTNQCNSKISGQVITADLDTASLGGRVVIPRNHRTAPCQRLQGQQFADQSGRLHHVRPERANPLPSRRARRSRDQRPHGIQRQDGRGDHRPVLGQPEIRRR
jgi:hypothetical protein